MQTHDKEPSSGGRPALLILPLMILIGLLCVPGTRALLQTQVRLLYDATPFTTRLKEMEVRRQEGGVGRMVEQASTAAVVARYPDDFAIQLGGAVRGVEIVSGGASVAPSEVFARFQHLYGERLAAVRARFPNRPGPCALILRLMAEQTVGVSRDFEIEQFQTGKTPNVPPDRHHGCAASWAAFDAAAAQGEKLDPDNSYFPLMRAIELFDAKRDADGIAAVLRAGQKARFDDYAWEEPEARWALFTREYGPCSLALRQTIYAETVHFGTLRALARMAAYKATRAEQEGRAQEGLALRHAMMQCGLQMRTRGSIVRAFEGIDLEEIVTRRSGAEPNGIPPAKLTSDQRREFRRDRYLAYLHTIGTEDEARWFAEMDAGNRALRALIQTADNEIFFDLFPRSVLTLWTLDMLLLSNLLMMLVLSTVAILGRRLPAVRKALPVMVVGLAALSVLAALSMEWAEAFTQLRTTLDAMGLLSRESEQRPSIVDVAFLMREYPWLVHLGEVCLSLLIPTAALLSIGITSMIRRETFAVGLSRRLWRSGLTLTTVLTVVYAATLSVTAWEEARYGAASDSRTREAIGSLQHQARVVRKQ
jgi:hypothetical protein